MNKINSEITDEDQRQARGKSAAALAEGILNSLRCASPFDLTFAHDIPMEFRQAAQADLKRRFELWANTWIAPLCRQIIAKQKIV